MNGIILSSTGLAMALAWVPAASGAPVPRADWSFLAPRAGANFAYSVASAGDVNGDGFDDVIVGAPGAWSDQGAAALFLGGPAGVEVAPSWIAQGSVAGESFGASVSSAGDVNGDGFDDVILGAPEFTNGETGEGAVFVYFGSAAGLETTAAWSAESNQIDGSLGNAVASAGDVNGDGYDDVIAGAVTYTKGQSREGIAMVFHGGIGGLGAGPAWLGEADQSGSGYGFAVASAGDLNGDGYDDVVVGAPWWNNVDDFYTYYFDEGAAFVYHGSATGLRAAYDWRELGDQGPTGTYFGFSVASACDVNGDGFDDFAIGAPQYAMGRGAAYLYYGSARGPSLGWWAHGRRTDGYGVAVASGGDMNGDGFDELVVGAQMDLSQGDEGGVALYFGGAAGPSGVPQLGIRGDAANGYLGNAAAGAGDVNGDGLGDLLVGAPGYPNGQRLDAGAAFLYLGR